MTFLNAAAAAARSVAEHELAGIRPSVNLLKLVGACQMRCSAAASEHTRAARSAVSVAASYALGQNFIAA